MTRESRRLAGVLLIVMPIVMYGGVALLTLLMNDPEYMANPLRQDLWRAGHAHAGVLLVFALVALRYVDEARLSAGLKGLARHSIPLAAILMPGGFFLSVLRPDASHPNALISLVYAGAGVLAAGVVILGGGLMRGRPGGGPAQNTSMFVEVLSPTYHSPITIEPLIYGAIARYRCSMRLFGRRTSRAPAQTPL